MDAPRTARKPQKLRRNPRACDFCNARSVKCKTSDDDPSRCQNCFDYAEQCSFDRPIRRRGARPKSTRAPAERPSIRASVTSPKSPAHDAHERHEVQTRAGCGDSNVSSSSVWAPKMVPPQAIVMDLTEIYFEVVYPVFPFFHRPTLLRRVSRGEYINDRPLFASVMAMCALSSARARDGALYSAKWDPRTLQNPTSEELLDAAAEAIPTDAPLSQELGYMRAYALLSIISIQYGNLRQMNYYLCLYHSCVAVGMLQDESNWPMNIGHVEIEERRRLFWSTYTLDVFSSIIWGGVLKSREACFNVCYPTECDDETFDDVSYSAVESANEAPGVVWLKGWNFVTDLYRILEHTVEHLRRLRQNMQRTPSIQALWQENIPPQSDVVGNIMALYESLPAIFKTTKPVTGNLRIDLYGFQAANIAASLQLVRMVLFTTEHSTVDQKCQIAGQVISGFASVPVAYLRAISSPLLHHLAGIGTILGSAFENGLTESSYRQVRSVLLDLANLLANLEIDLYCKAGTSDGLRAQVSRIDEFMNIQRSVTTSRSAGEPATWSQAQINGSLEQSFTSPNLHESSMASEESPPIYFPAELFENWSWDFDFNSFN